MKRYCRTGFLVVQLVISGYCPYLLSAIYTALAIPSRYLLDHRSRFEPPTAKTQPKELTAAGDTRVDFYYWLREKDDPEVLSYLEEENGYTSSVMQSTEPLQQELYSEMLARIQEDDMDVPYRKGSFLYYSRSVRGQSYALFCRKKSAQADEEILLDYNQLAQGLPFFASGICSVSLNEELLAYSTDANGDETFTVRVKDLASGTLLPIAIPGTYYTFAWANDNRHFFYVTLDAAKRPYRVWRHHLDQPEDYLVFEEADERFEVELSKSRSGDFIFIESESKTASEVRFLRADQPLGEFQVVWPRQQNVLYDVSARGDEFYIRTNADAIDFRLLVAPAGHSAMENAREVLPSRAGVFLEEVHAFADFVAAFERHAGLPQILYFNPETASREYILFDEPAYALAAGPNEVYDSTTLRFEYSSLLTPRSVFDYNMSSGERTLMKQVPVLGGYHPDRYRSERLTVPSRDGSASIPVSLVYRKDRARTGRGPLLLYGYGSYGITIEAPFNSQRLSLLDRGFAYAIAHIRGGADLGRSWYEDGKLLKKKNTFHDFIDVAQYLVDHDYTSPKRLAIQGGSAGGLLMGAVTNWRPGLFKAVFAQVPYVDCLTTGLDPTLPLTVGEYEEWGPADEQPYYDYIKSYCPYDQVERQAYPHMLITAGLNDPRVSYWEPAKWVAKLRALKTDTNLLLLKTDLQSGHGGPSGRYEKLKEIAFAYAFLLRCLES